MIEGSKIMFFKYVNKTPNTYLIELKGPTYSQYNPGLMNSSNTNIFEGDIARDSETGKAQLFAVAFAGEDTPLVELYLTYKNESTELVVDFMENDTFNASVWVFYPDGSIMDGPVNGTVALIPE